MSFKNRYIDWGEVVEVSSFVVVILFAISMPIIAHYHRQSKYRKNVVMNNDEKNKLLTLYDIKDKKTRSFVYTDMAINGKQENFRFVEQGDTLTLEIMRNKYARRAYRPKNGPIDGYTMCYYEVMLLHPNNEIYNRIQRYEYQAALEQIRKKQKQNAVTDSLRNEFVNMNKRQRIIAEKNIAEFGNDYQKNALTVIRNEEKQKRINDSIQLAKQIAEQQRIEAEKKAERERIEAEKQRKIKLAQTIRQHKRNGTLWQYVAENKTTLIDTVRIIRIYSEKRFDLGGGVSYSSSHNSSQQGGGGGGAVIGGIGGGYIDPIEGQSSGSASGRGQISANYKSANAVVAQDRYGYTYTLPVDPMLDLKKGDKIVIEYMGRRTTETGYFDMVKMLQVMYQSQR